jgi:competence protein ComFC
MRCILCERFSFSHICPPCRNTLLQPNISKRKLENGIDVISFYPYEEIKELLHTKHTDLGYYIYSILADASLRLFAKEFNLQEQIASIAVDDRVKNGYSHTALLNKSLQNKAITPRHGTLHAHNNVSYSGKTKVFRQQNPRNFSVKEFPESEVILVDDIVTTGLTLQEACAALEKEHKKILFCLTLADAKQEVAQL